MSRTPASLSGLFFNTNVLTNSQVSLSNISALQGLTSGSIEAQVYIYNYPSADTGRVFSYFSASNQGYRLLLNPGGTFGGTFTNGTATVTATSTSMLPINSWHKLETSWDGANVRLFLDGVVVATSALSGGNTSNPGVSPTIGNASSNQTWPGIISELRISSIARHTANYTVETTPFANDANTVGLYHLSEGQGGIVNDSSASANNGTLSGSPLPVWSNGYFSGQVGSRSLAVNRASVQNFPCSLSLNNNVASTLSIPLSSALSGTGYTMFCRAKFFSFAGTGGSAQIMFVAGGIEMLINTNQFTLFGSSFVYAGQPSIGQWYDLAVTRNGTATNGYIMYINGTPVITTTRTVDNLSGTTLFIGSGNNVQRTNMLVCNTLTWQRILSPIEIMTLHTTGAFNPTSLLTNNPCIEGSQSTSYDISGNGNNGTITLGTYTYDVPSKTRGIVGGSLLYNGNFEFAPPAPTTSNSNNAFFGGSLRTVAGTVSNLFDNANAHTGAFSMKVSAVTAGAYAILYWGGGSVGTPVTTINGAPYAIPNTNYTMTFWMKTNLVSGTSSNGAYIALTVKNTGGTTVASASSSAILTTTGWTQYTINLNTGANYGCYLVPNLIVQGNSGAATLIMDAWFDDLVLTPTTNTTRGTAV